MSHIYQTSEETFWNFPRASNEWQLTSRHNADSERLATRAKAR
jgi:hypothetical protein